MVVMISGGKDVGVIEVYSPDGRCSQTAANRPSAPANNPNPVLGYINGKISTCNREGGTLKQKGPHTPGPGACLF